mmetsp:Transcript_4953/g.8829  ORF Transcript_4953/g.8829 Transcript_4953/m.8829 type:complete len:303 (+) Transcript_4953:1323-2231(+)
MGNPDALDTAATGTSFTVLSMLTSMSLVAFGTFATFASLSGVNVLSMFSALSASVATLGSNESLGSTWPYFTFLDPCVEVSKAVSVTCFFSVGFGDSCWFSFVETPSESFTSFPVSFACTSSSSLDSSLDATLASSSSSSSFSSSSLLLTSTESVFSNSLLAPERLSEASSAVSSSFRSTLLRPRLSRRAVVATACATPAADRPGGAAGSEGLWDAGAGGSSTPCLLNTVGTSALLLSLPTCSIEPGTRPERPLRFVRYQKPSSTLRPVRISPLWTSSSSLRDAVKSFVTLTVTPLTENLCI